MNDIHICSPEPVKTEKASSFCPTCDKESDFVVQYFEWYAPIMICTECGEEYNEDGRTARPFRRNWREENKARAKRMLEANR